MTKPVLYYHFKSKEGIYLETLRETLEEFEALLETLAPSADRGGVLTNIVNLHVGTAGWKAPLYAERLLGHGIKAKVCTEHTLRMVAHNDISAREVTFVLDRVGEVLRGRA